MLEKAKVGDKFVISEPSGDFTYSRIRDKKNIICIAGGSGITPFVSMAHAIVDKNEDCKMTLFYGCRTLSSACYIDELNKLVGANFKLVVVTSDEKFRNFLNRPSRILIMSITDASHKFPNLKIVK